MYWWLNLIVQVYTTVFGIFTQNYTIYQYVFGGIEIFLALSLVILLLKTKKRVNERPNRNQVIDSSSLKDIDSGIENLRKNWGAL